MSENGSSVGASAEVDHRASKTSPIGGGGGGGGRSSRARGRLVPSISIVVEPVNVVVECGSGAGELAKQRSGEPNKAEHHRHSDELARWAGHERAEAETEGQPAAGKYEPPWQDDDGKLGKLGPQFEPDSGRGGPLRPAERRPDLGDDSEEAEFLSSELAKRVLLVDEADKMLLVRAQSVKSRSRSNNKGEGRQDDELEDEAASLEIGQSEFASETEPEPEQGDVWPEAEEDLDYLTLRERRLKSLISNGGSGSSSSGCEQLFANCKLRPNCESSVELGELRIATKSWAPAAVDSARKKATPSATASIASNEPAQLPTLEPPLSKSNYDNKQLENSNNNNNKRDDRAVKHSQQQHSQPVQPNSVERNQLECQFEAGPQKAGLKNNNNSQPQQSSRSSSPFGLLQQATVSKDPNLDSEFRGERQFNEQLRRGSPIDSRLIGDKTNSQQLEQQTRFYRLNQHRKSLDVSKASLASLLRKQATSGRRSTLDASCDPQLQLQYRAAAAAAANPKSGSPSPNFASNPTGSECSSPGPSKIPITRLDCARSVASSCIKSPKRSERARTRRVSFGNLDHIQDQAERSQAAAATRKLSCFATSAGQQLVGSLVAQQQQQPFHASAAPTAPTASNQADPNAAQLHTIKLNTNNQLQNLLLQNTRELDGHLEQSDLNLKNTNIQPSSSGNKLSSRKGPASGNHNNRSNSIVVIESGPKLKQLESIRHHHKRFSISSIQKPAVVEIEPDLEGIGSKVQQQPRSALEGQINFSANFEARLKGAGEREGIIGSKGGGGEGREPSRMMEKQGENETKTLLQNSDQSPISTTGADSLDQSDQFSSSNALDSQGQHKSESTTKILPSPSISSHITKDPSNSGPETNQTNRQTKKGSRVESIMANAKLRQEEFARLLEEHEQIVNEINRVETKMSTSQSSLQQQGENHK